MGGQDGRDGRVAAVHDHRPGGQVKACQPADPVVAETATSTWLLYSPVVAFTVLTVVMGFWAEPFLEISMQASQALFSPDGYVRAVLEAAP